MKTIVLVLSAALATAVWADAAKGVWEPKRAVNGTRLWELKGKPGVIGVLRSKRNDSAIDWSGVRSKQVFENIAEQKRQILSLIGISEWNAENYSWKRGASYHELTVEGTYRDNSSQKIAFWERNLFGPWETYTILVTSPDDGRPSPQSIEDFVTRAKDTIASEATR